MTEGSKYISRLGRPEQARRAVLYLCSEEAPQGVILQAADGRVSRNGLGVAETVDLGPEVSCGDPLSVCHEIGLDQVL
jgi:hypothetical protein